MINFSEIQPGDLLKVLVNIDDIDDETYAIAKENMKDYLVVNYYSIRRRYIKVLVFMS